MVRTLTLCRFALAFAGIAAAQPATYDVILRNGTVVDGTGARGYRADVAVRNGFIYRIGDLRGEKAGVDLDVSGLVVAPGFLNIHSHPSQRGLRTAVNMLTQGVTTEILNPDGGGNTDIARQLADLSSEGLAVNIGAYIGFNSIWASVMGRADRRPSVDELQKMRDLLVANLKQGAWGVSAGLDYKPAYYARTEEVISVVKAAAPWRTNFPNHDRLTPESKYSSFVGMSETVEIGGKTGLLPVITHMKVQGVEQGSAAKVLAMMNAAAARGQEPIADVYPYLAGQTGLGALLVPAWAQEGGPEEMRKRFRDAEQRTRIAREIEEALAARFLSAENVFLPAKQRKLTEYMRDWGTGAGETIIRILEQESPSAILTFGSESDLVELLKFPGSAIACDCGAYDDNPGLHPRFYGTFPRVLGHYVRETKALTMEDAVRKMTGLPASIIGMADRGFVAAGMAADLTVFDPATIIDHATYEQPTRPSDGVRFVLVNGRIALRDGKATGEKGGRVLRRPENMPSRSMNSMRDRSLSVKAKGVEMEIKQGVSGRAEGTFRWVDEGTGNEFRVKEMGLLQVSGQWASFTATVRGPQEGEEQGVIVIVDGGNPMSTHPTVQIAVEGGRHWEFALASGEYRMGARQ
ncbi:MAG TPA: amidohydrolase family protein [Bryobacteraceae bacterium]|nr:amidohydrolase family protein [Bryobacteraceae bacterium]